jgi:hypothetical protein
MRYDNSQNQSKQANGESYKECDRTGHAQWCAISGMTMTFDLVHLREVKLGYKRL